MSVQTITKLNPTSPLIPLDITKILFLIIHHVGAVRYTWEQCNSDHKLNGWACAGYNEMIYKNGNVFVLRGDHIGAQCQNMNSKSYGIALEGNYDIEMTMPIAQFKSLVERLRYHKSRLPNLVEIAPHKKFVTTNCPGKYLDLNTILASVNEDPYASVNLLTKYGIISTPDYWIDNLYKASNQLNSGYVKTLIDKMAQYLRK